MERIEVHQGLLDANAVAAGRLRERFHGAGTLTVNLLSSPGAGKTSLLESLLPRWRGLRRTAVIEGDLATTLDRDRIAALDIPAVQITTGTLCHLEASLIENALQTLPGPLPEILFIENVGNLICPANFDLGESLRIALLSTPEGADKPRKYPILFHGADLVLVTKADLLPHLDLTVADLEDSVRSVNAEAPVLPVSARTGQGIETLFHWIDARTPAYWGSSR
jgi:hydrogenase nickel incorporation protein HypB